MFLLVKLMDLNTLSQSWMQLVQSLYLSKILLYVELSPNTKKSY